jgi:hypothetical protein
MRRIDLGVFESSGRTPGADPEGAGPRHGEASGDLVAFAVFLGPELHRDGGADCAAGVIKHWADSDAALLAQAETVAYQQHHMQAAELLRRARQLATA